MRSKPCGAWGCKRQVRPGLLMCPEHWRMVPQEIRSEVLITWRRFLKVGHEARGNYNTAVAKACQAVEAAKGRKDSAR